MHTLNINNTNVDVTIYSASPMTTADEKHKFNLYIIPISRCKQL